MSKHLQSEEFYLRAFRNGEEAGFDYFFNSFYRALCFFSNQYVNDVPASEELAEDAFLAVWERRTQFDSASGLRSYLYKTVYHKSLRWLENKKRANGHIKALAQISDKEQADFTETYLCTETLRLVRNAMDHLPEQCKKVFYKLYIEGKSVAETASELKLTISTIKNQKARGIKLLKLRLLSLSSFLFLLMFS